MEDTANTPNQEHVPQKPKTSEVFRTEANQVVETMVQKIVSGEKLTPDELKDLQERKIKSLDPHDRDRIRGVREKLGSLAERFGKRIQGLQFQASKKELQSMQSQTFNEAARNEFAGDALFLRETSTGLEQDWKEQQDIAYREMWHDAEGGEVVKVDPFTGLKTRGSLMGRIADNVIAWQRTGDEKHLNKVRVRAGDLDNFKQGNDILGHNGFDKFLKNQLAEKMKQVAVYTGSTVYEDELNQGLIDEMFPPDSEERKQLDSLKGKVIIDSYRMKSGADEIFTAYEKINIDMPEPEFDEHTINADKVVNRILSSCVIGRYEKQEETTVIKDKFEASPLALRIRRSDTDNGDFSMVSFEADYWNNCAKEIASYLSYSRMGEPIVTNDPPTVLRMSAGMTPARGLVQGVEKFTSGENFTGKKVINGEARGGAGYASDPSKIQEYEESVMSTATRRLASVGAGDEAEVRGIIERAAVDKIDGYFLEVLMDEADDKAKPQGKRDLVVSSWTAQAGTQQGSELALQLGSLAVAGRLEKAVASREDRVAVFKETVKVFGQKGVQEVERLKQVFVEMGYTDELLTQVDNSLITDIVRKAGENGRVNTNVLYAYQALLSINQEYEDNFNKFHGMYDSKGAKLQLNNPHIELPYSNQQLNDKILSSISGAAYRHKKPFGLVH
jgi:hypothetical protein